MTNNFNSIMSCFVKAVENSVALHGRILCTGINDLMSKGRFSESTHPVYKQQDASHTPVQGAAPCGGPEQPGASFAQGEQFPSRLSSVSGRAGGAAVLAGPLSLRGRPCLLRAALPRVAGAPEESRRIFQ